MSRLSAPLLPFRDRTVVVGVSGGADSVALLRALVQVGARPVAVHLDHALREGSAQDAAWVLDLAARLEVPARSTRVEVAAVAQRRGWNLEDAARRVRYDLLSREARAAGAGLILTAHTRRDQAETVLMQLLRGEAVLGGIPPARGHVRRPWLEIGRPEIVAFLHGLGQDWREDPSNADTSRTRAWLRQDVLPLLARRVPGLETSLARLARFQAGDDATLQALAAGLNDHLHFVGQPDALLRRWVRRELGRAGLDAHAGHIEALARALGTGQTAHLTLPGSRQLTATGGRLVQEAGPATFTPPPFDLPPGWIRRTRQPGDRIRLPGGTRRLSDVLTDRHCPRGQRDLVPLLVSADGAVQWVGLEPPVWAVGAGERAGVPADPLQSAMGEALALAREAASAGEVPVGALVLGPDGQVVGRGRNRSRARADMTRHAELEALRAACATLGSPYLDRCTLVVTLEPCPMCLGAALEARVGHIVFGARNHRAGALGGVSDLLAHHWGVRPRITADVRADEAARLLRHSFAALRARSQPATGPD